MTRVSLSSSLWKLTMPLCDIPLVVFQAIRSFLRCSVISASHCRRLKDLLLPADLVASLPLDVEHPAHELRELVEARPCLVGPLDRHRHVGPALDRNAPRLLRAAAPAAGDLRERLPGEPVSLGRRSAPASRPERHSHRGSRPPLRPSIRPCGSVRGSGRGPWRRPRRRRGSTRER